MIINFLLDLIKHGSKVDKALSIIIMLILLKYIIMIFASVLETITILFTNIPYILKTVIHLILYIFSFIFYPLTEKLRILKDKLRYTDKEIKEHKEDEEIINEHVKILYKLNQEKNNE
jgi:hypothetical protein